MAIYRDAGSSLEFNSLSPLARMTIIDMPVFERRAPGLTATLVTTSLLPRSTNTSVITELSRERSAILLRCDWPLLSAISTRFSSVSRGDCDSTGPATAMSSSAASWRMTWFGALAIGARSQLSSTRARLSTWLTKRTMTSSNTEEISSLMRSRPARNRPVTLLRIAVWRSEEPLLSAASSSSMICNAGDIFSSIPAEILPAALATQLIGAYNLRSVGLTRKILRFTDRRIAAEIQH